MKSKKNIKSIVVMAVLGIIALFFINNSFAANTAKVNVETANLRQLADANSKILKQISIDEEVEILEKSGDWYKVKSGKTTGYLRQDLITVKDEVQPITDSNAENSVEESNTNQEQQIEQQTEQKPVEIDEKNKQVVEDTKLKIVPSINATDIIEVKKDEKVEIIETINGWVCIQTETTKGWIRAEKLKAIEEKTVEQPQEESGQTVQEPEVEKPTKLKTSYINSQTVNLRKEASKDSEVLAKLSLNTAVDVFSEENGWSKVKVGEREGYISSALLSNKKQETSRNLETPRETTGETNQTAQKQESVTVTVPTSGKGATVVETAKSYIGSKYVYGAAGPNSFDCSGFTSYIFKQHGVSLNRTAAAQYSNGVAVSRDQLQPGDLIMFGKSGINHVGIYIGGGQMVHAANASRGVTTDTINSGYYNNNYVGARRVI